MKPLRVHLRLALLVVAAFGVLGIAAATWVHLMGDLEGRSATIVQTVLFVMPFWMLWALYAPVVVWATRRFPIERGHLIDRIAGHLGLAVTMSLANTGIRFALQPSLRESLTADAAGVWSWTPLRWLATLELPVHLFLYSGILAAAHVALYLHRSRERELAATRLQAQLADARIQALRMQLNPHFLFNALNSVAMLVRHEEKEAAVETLEGMSDLLRYVLDGDGGQEVSLRREIDFIQRYLAIEKIRYQDRLEVAFDVPSDTLDALVPSLVLQPLVENAVRHGVAASVGAASVTVISRREGETLRLTVQDDGPGFQGATDGPGKTGLGIANTQKRLAELFGEKAGLEVEDRLPQGAAVTVALPFHLAPRRGGELP